MPIDIPLTGPLLFMSEWTSYCKKALQIATEIGIHDFKASGSWLENFRIRHMSLKNVTGELSSTGKTVVFD